MTTEYIKHECFHDAIKILKKYVEAFSKTEENLEIEFRLGYIEEEEFNTDVGKDYFEKINAQLIDCVAWSSIEEEKTHDYFYSGKRLTIMDKGKKKDICVKKEKIAVIDFKFSGTGFDLRVSFSREIPCNKFSIEKANYKRIKERRSFNYKGAKTDLQLSYDLTKVTFEENTVENNNYEIELEIKKFDLNKVSSHFIIHDCLLKVYDMVKMCEEVDDKCKLIVNKEKVYKTIQNNTVQEDV